MSSDRQTVVGIGAATNEGRAVAGDTVTSGDYRINADMYRALGRMFRDVAHDLEQRIPRLDRDQAAYIRLLRCERGMTYRAVAWHVHEEWRDPWVHWTPPYNWIAGQVLCKRAAAYFGDNHAASPWAQGEPLNDDTDSK